MIKLEEGPAGSYIVRDVETGDSILFQTDFEWPSLAITFGWPDGEEYAPFEGPFGEFFIRGAEAIAAAVEYLDAHLGDEVEDVGYFGPPR